MPDLATPPFPDWERLKKDADQRQAEANTAKAVADTLKSAADASKAQSDAALAALKARVGEVPDSGYTGDVALKDRAGAVEAALQGARAVRIAATRIADRVRAVRQDPTRALLVFGAKELPTFAALTAFRVQVALVSQAFEEASAASQALVGGVAPPMTSALTASAAGLTLDAVNKLLGFFKTDYTVGGVELALGDALLVHAVAATLIAAGEANVQVPATYNPAAAAGGRVLEPLVALSRARQRGLRLIQQHESRLTALATSGGTEATAHDVAAVELWKAAIALHDAMSARLATVDDKGTTSLVAIVREATVAEALSGGADVLIVTVHASGGTFYTTKNLWTALGRMPFYHAGGAVTGFLLLEGETGRALAGDIVPVHSGFLTSSALQNSL